MGPRLLDRFVRLPAADRSLLVRSVLLLGAARLALWVMPLQAARRLLARAARHPVPTSVTPERITWAVAAAERVVPAATCLPQALAAEALLARYGHPSTLRIGVVKNERRRLVAHAWVESGGRIVVGELREGLSEYTPLPPLPGAGA
jgi:transglutaminase superfamily protein